MTNSALQGKDNQDKSGINLKSILGEGESQSHREIEPANAVWWRQGFFFPLLTPGSEEEEEEQNRLLSEDVKVKSS